MKIATYDTNLTDAQWAYLQPMLPKPAKLGRPPKDRRRIIDAILYLEAVKAIYEKGYEWIDGSVTSENNPIVNLIAKRLGAEQYKHYRVYKMSL